MLVRSDIAKSGRCSDPQYATSTSCHQHVTSMSPEPLMASQRPKAVDNINQIDTYSKNRLRPWCKNVNMMQGRDMSHEANALEHSPLTCGVPSSTPESTCIITITSLISAPLLPLVIGDMPPLRRSYFGHTLSHSARP